MPKKCTGNGANKPDVLLDKTNKEWFVIFGTVCVPEAIPAKTIFKRDKYSDLD